MCASVSPARSKQHLKHLIRQTDLTSDGWYAILIASAGDGTTSQQMTIATAQAQTFEVGQIVFGQSGCTMTHVTFFVVDRISAKSVWLRAIAKFTTETSHGQGTACPNPLRQAPDSCVFRMKIQHDDDGSQCAYDRLNVYRIWDGQPCYVNSWD